MDYPISVDENGVKIKPEKMEKEKLYHCIFKEKAMLVFKDSQDVMNCYEIEEKDLVEKIKKIDNDDDLEKLFDDYLKAQDLKN
ncbi:MULTISPECIES: hypothetical protein [Nitrosopumilus]|uniref:Uncharacterized protein n=1 Tax=Nitrosopumilus piranensis TaxID=1582439 RepID=A0A0C5BX41_9ARCH|nr:MULTISPECIES: hypothetical protein [Nitrosopumilus]AJM92834.1 hypothetical protein NPIRD3C_1622 [Nitrosopumilus piranensis]KAF6244642.1 hypothetical protein C6989_07155 [Nitrosopumilus sp. b2]